MNVYTPKNSLQPIRFCALVGTEAEIDDRRVIIGKWKSPPKVFSGSRGHLLIEDFLNWRSDDASVLRFIRRYGPLYLSPTSDESFAVNIVHWSAWKRSVRRLWEGLMEDPHSFELEETMNNAVLSYVNRRFEFRPDWLITFMELELASCDRKRLRKCAAPDCDSPYFVARHLRQKYCSDKCAQWAQKTWKKKWWEEHGDEWRHAHAKKRTDLLGKHRK